MLLMERVDESLPFFTYYNIPTKYILLYKNRDKYSMTLYFTNGNVNPYWTDFFLDGDWSGVNDMFPNGYLTYRLELISKYTNKEYTLEPLGGNIQWIFDVTFIEANERYTHLRIPGLQSQAYMADKFASGYYDFKLWATYLDILQSEDFEEYSWNVVLEGEAKVKTETTNDMQRGQPEETVKYTTDPNTAQSYVIYNP